jgi:hypothetical protein
LKTENWKRRFPTVWQTNLPSKYVAIRLTYTIGIKEHSVVFTRKTGTTTPFIVIPMARKKFSRAVYLGIKVLENTPENGKILWH